MAYDPSSDPRYIPPDNFEERQERERESEQDAIDRQLHEVGQLVSLFQHPGWEVLAARLTRERESAQAVADKTYEIGAWHFIRGQGVMLDYFLSLPSRTESTRRSLLQQARDLAPPGGEEVPG